MKARHLTEKETKAVLGNYMIRTASETAKMFKVSKQTVLYHWHRKYGKQKIKQMYVKPIKFKLNKDELIFLAGVIDARASIGITGVDGKTDQRPYIAIGSKHEQIIKDIASKLKVKYYKRKKDEYYHINIRKLGIKSLLEELLPHLVTKKDRAALVIKYINLRKEDLTGKKYTDTEVKICRCLHYLNARKVKDRKNWETEIRKKYNKSPEELKNSLLQ